jgi:glycosyltransferase 2 family protein
MSALCLLFVFQKVGVEDLITHIDRIELRYFISATIAYLISLYLSAFRWCILLEHAHPIRKLYSLTLIGAFFNNLLPGAVGGDAMKVYYLYRETKEVGKSLASVFMDRYIGYVGLLSIGLVAGLIAFRDLSKVGMQWAAPLLFAAFLSGSLLAFGMRIGRRFSSFTSFYDYFHNTLRNRPVLMRSYTLSLAIQALTVLAVFLIARSIGQRPPFMALFVFVPLIITIMAVPISIAGLGIRESAFVLLFGLIGIPAEASAAIAFLWFLSIATGSLVGLVEFARYRKHIHPIPQA